MVCYLNPSALFYMFQEMTNAWKKMHSCSTEDIRQAQEWQAEQLIKPRIVAERMLKAN